MAVNWQPLLDPYLINGLDQNMTVLVQNVGCTIYRPLMLFLMLQCRHCECFVKWGLILTSFRQVGVALSSIVLHGSATPTFTKVVTPFTNQAYPKYINIYITLLYLIR